MLSHLYIIVPDNQTMNKIDGSTLFKIATKYPITWWTVIWMTTWYYFCAIFCSVFLHLLFSHSVVSDFLRLHGLQHIRLPCPSPSPRVCTNTGPLSWWCHPTTSSSLISFSYLQSFPASGSFLVTALWIRWSKYWSFSFSISSSNEFSELVSIKTDWFDLLAVQGIHKSLLLHYSSKASIIWCSAFFMVQLWPYMTAGKTIALTIWTFFYIISVITICDISYLLYRTDY